jgi:hypothetical protein
MGVTMRRVVDESGREWIVTAREEETPRHHGRWYMTFVQADDEAAECPYPDVRWQTYETGERTIQTMSDFELKRRLTSAVSRRAARASGV